MSLPDFSNQYLNISTFTSALQCSDAQKILRAKLKRRSVTANQDTFDADWTTLTSYVLDIGSINYGLDDQTFLSGIMRSSNVDLVVDNTAGKFNDRSDTGSIWYDSGTDFYIPNSLIEVEFGFKMPDGTEYYSPKPFLSGLIRGDSIEYGTNNTCKFTLVSKLDYLKKINIFDVTSIGRATGFSAIGLIDGLITYTQDNFPASLALTITANYPRRDMLFKDVEQLNTDALSFAESVAKNTGSLFGINRDNEIFFTYFNNTYTQDTIATLANDSSTIMYYACNETSSTAALVDTGTFGHDLTLTSGGIVSITAGKFGSGRRINGLASGTQNRIQWTGHLTLAAASSGAYTFEFLFRSNKLNSEAHIETNVNTSTSFFPVYIGKEEEQMYINPDNGTFRAQGNALYLGENLWNYFACTHEYDGGAKTLKYWLNGSQILSTTGLDIRPIELKLRAQRFNESLEFDTIRVSDIARSEEDIKNATARIFGNTVTLNDSTTSVYDFYNYGLSSNIIDIEDYDNGFSKLYNTVVFEDKKATKATAEFSMSFGLSSVMLDAKLLDQHSTGFASSASYVRTFFGSFGPNRESNCVMTSLGSGWYNYVVSVENTDYKQILRSYAFISSYADITIPSIYYDYTSTSGGSKTALFHFEPVDSIEEYVFINTASVNEYGTFLYNVEEDDPITTLSQGTAIADSILDNYATPKIRMSLRTRFCEGDLDLLDKVTVNYKAHPQDTDMLEWNSGTWDSERWTELAGQITWETKEFYIVGVEHSWAENSTLYKLKEV